MDFTELEHKAPNAKEQQEFLTVPAHRYFHRALLHRGFSVKLISILFHLEKSF